MQKLGPANTLNAVVRDVKKVREKKKHQIFNLQDFLTLYINNIMFLLCRGTYLLTIRSL